MAQNALFSPRSRVNCVKSSEVPINPSANTNAKGDALMELMRSSLGPTGPSREMVPMNSITSAWRDNAKRCETELRRRGRRTWRAQRHNANRCETEVYWRGRRTWRAQRSATMRTVARRRFTGVVGELEAQQCEPLRDGGLLAWSANLAGATMRTVARRGCTGVVGELEAQQCEPLRDGAAQAWSANLKRNNANRCETELHRRGRRT